MDNENGTPKTGGLKLMTVFIVVLALHVLVIGGISAYHLFFKGEGEMASSALSQKDTKESVTENTTATPGTDATTTETLASNSTGNGIGPVVETDPGPNIAVPLRPEDGTASATSTTPPAGTALLKPATPETPVVEKPTTTTTTKPASAAVKTQAIKTPVATTGKPAITPAVMKPTATSSKASTYIVKAGDSLYKIAKTHGTSVKSLMASNGLKSNNLKIGQKLVIKSSKMAAPKTAEALAQTAVASTSEPSAPAADASSLYTVVKGDTLVKIAHQFKTTPKAIMAANGNVDPKRLAIGAKLKIPSQEAHNVVAPASAPATANDAPEAPKENPMDLVMSQ